MTKRIRIAVADDERDMREFYERFLPVLGYEVHSVSATGRQLLEHCRTSRPDLVIADIRMPDMDGVEAAKQLCEEKPLPIVLVSAYHDDQTVAKANSECILGYLVKPITEANLKPAVSVALRRFEESKKFHEEAEALKRTLEERKLVERAKGILGKRLNLQEEDAYRRLRKMASDHNERLADVARRLLQADEVFQAFDRL